MTHVDGHAPVARSEIECHIRRNWPAAKLEFVSWQEGPIEQAIPGFEVCQISPVEPSDPWVYMSCGASSVVSGVDFPLEFLITSPQATGQHIETLTMVAYLHSDPRYRLKLGSIIEIGRPWLGSSGFMNLLVSLPYPFGPSVEWLLRDNDLPDIRVLWLLPISDAERDFARAKGVESLERRFDAAAIDAIDPKRPSVV